jgi:hypothetical protein
LEYLADHAGYSRVHNPVTAEEDLVRLPGLVSVAYQHETSRCGDSYLHTHVIVPNRQARADGALVSIDGTSLYHEAKAAAVIYQATLRRELNRSIGLKWGPVDPSTGMAEVAGVRAETIRAWPQRSSQCANGQPTTSLSWTVTSPRRRNWPPRRKPPGPRNPKSWRGYSYNRVGARMRVACSSTAQGVTPHVRRASPHRARRLTAHGWPR